MSKKIVSTIIASVGLVPFFAALVGEKRNPEVTKARNELGFEGFLTATADALREKVSGSRGRPALEERPVHTMLKAVKAAMKQTDQNLAKEALKAGLAQARAEEQHLAARRELFKPSKRVQGEKRKFTGLYNEPAAS